MILSYNWQIVEQPIQSQQQLQERSKTSMPGPQDSFISQESGNISLTPTTLKYPCFGFLFCYYIESPQHNQPEIELVPEVSLFQEPIRLTVVQSSRTTRWIYLRLQIQNSEAYDNPMILTVKIRYHTQPKLPKISSIDQLVRMAGNRQINLYTATTYTTIKREFMLESPVVAEWKQEKDNYIYLKLSKLEDSLEEVQIVEVEIMNWLSNKEQVRKMEIRNLVKKRFRLKQKEAYALVFQTEGTLVGHSVPYYIIYRVGTQEKEYKMVKYLNLYDYK